MTGESEILFLCSRLPFPPNKGDKIRSHAILTHLMKNHRVHLGCFAESDQEMRALDAARAIVNGECFVEPIPIATRYGRMAGALVRGQSVTAALFSSDKLRSWVKSLSRQRELAGAVLFGSAMADCLLEIDTIDPANVLFDMVDIDSDKWLQLAQKSRGPRRWIYAREARLLLALERRAAKNFGATLLISPYESAGFARLAPEAAFKTKSLVNGVDLEFFAPGSFANPYAKDRIVVAMTGHMDYRPNTDAAIWFADDVLPILRRAKPEICFYAVGANPPAVLRSRASEGCVVTGYVDDIRPYIQHAHAIVAPLRIARGLQNKVLEAMAMGRPVVATWEASRALAAEPGRDLLVANDAPTFAKSVLDAITSPDRENIAASGRRYAQTHHDWNRLMEDFEGMLGSVLRKPAARSNRVPASSGSVRTALSRQGVV